MKTLLVGLLGVLISGGSLRGAVAKGVDADPDLAVGEGVLFGGEGGFTGVNG